MENIYTLLISITSDVKIKKLTSQKYNHLHRLKKMLGLDNFFRKFLCQCT